MCYIIQAAVLSMDESVLDVDQVENLIKFCPTKEEMELLKVNILCSNVGLAFIHFVILRFFILFKGYPALFTCYVKPCSLLTIKTEGLFVHHFVRDTLATRINLESVNR